MASASTDPIVSLGGKVKAESLTDDSNQLAFTLIAGDNDTDQGRIGVHTPVGAALIDAQVGDEVEY